MPASSCRFSPAGTVRYSHTLSAALSTALAVFELLQEIFPASFTGFASQFAAAADPD
jgi:hypothetical protein